MQLLGTVQHGPQISALRKLPEGRYVQVINPALLHLNFAESPAYRIHASN
ncbi:MAG: hypothetical protein ACK5O3_07360 [Burkholderiales bacterium]|jgi:hypothetical protein